MKNKKEILNEEPTTPEQISSNIRSYFTKEINEQISEMSVKEMESVMKDLVNTRYWIAILKYTSKRTPLLDASLRSINPYQDPHSISWTQGAMAGVCDIEAYVIELNSPKQSQEESVSGQQEFRKDGDPIGNY